MPAGQGGGGFSIAVGTGGELGPPGRALFLWRNRGKEHQGEGGSFPLEPHSLVGKTGEGGWSDWSLACGLQDQRLMARPPARAGGRSGSLTGGKKWETKWFFSSFSQRVPVHVPSPPSRWAGRYGPFNVRAAGQVSSEKYSLPPHHPTREGGPGGGTSSPGGSFPHFFPRNGAPAGQAKVP